MASLLSPKPGLKMMIKDEKSNTVRTYDHVDISCVTDSQEPYIKIGGDVAKQMNEIDLRDCTLIENSSVPGSAECIRVGSLGRTIVFLDKEKNCEKQLSRLRRYLTAQNRVMNSEQVTRTVAKDIPSVGSKQKESTDQLIDKLVKALNKGKVEKAQKYATTLAAEKAAVSFVLNSVTSAQGTNKHGEAAPVPKLFEVNVRIETLSNALEPAENFRILIREHTTVAELKDLLELQSKIEAERQWWFLDRTCLQDDYSFGDNSPHIDEQSVLTVVIAAPTA